MAMADDNNDENTKTNTSTGDNHKNDYGDDNQHNEWLILLCGLVCSVTALGWLVGRVCGCWSTDCLALWLVGTTETKPAKH